MLVFFFFFPRNSTDHLGSIYRYIYFLLMFFFSFCVWLFYFSFLGRPLCQLQVEGSNRSMVNGVYEIIGSYSYRCKHGACNSNVKKKKKQKHMDLFFLCMCVCVSAQGSNNNMYAGIYNLLA